MKTYYTAQEAANVLHLSVRKVRDYIKEGRLEASKVGRAYLVSDEALSRFVDSFKEA